MDFILRGYHVNNETWFYLSFLLIIAVYFKFSRLWSIRNLDLVLMLLVAPGLLLVPHASVASLGYAWLFGVSAVLLVRILMDGMITRRPRLEQNMNAAGMMFLCASTFVFLMTKVMTDPPSASAVESVRRASQILEREAVPANQSAPPTATVERDAAGPGTSLVAVPVTQIAKAVAVREPDSAIDHYNAEMLAARITAILAHLAVIIGLILVGKDIYSDVSLGIAMATLYMLLPMTSFDVGRLNHVLPAALIVWATWAYRRPFLSGTVLGLACGMMFFPIFLLPLWAAFYGRRGGLRFVSAVLVTTAVIISSLLLTSDNQRSFLQQMLGYTQWDLLQFRAGDSLEGFWMGREAYRIPVFATYVVMVLGLTIWPRQKSLAQVIPHSTAVVLGTQFWYPQQGGVYVLWYLPLLLLALFRPTMVNHFAPEVPPFFIFRRRNTGEQPLSDRIGAGTHGTLAG